MLDHKDPWCWFFFVPTLVLIVLLGPPILAWIAIWLTTP